MVTGRPGTDLVGLPGLPWESLSHRQVLAELVGAGWVDGGALYSQILEDVSVVHRRIPPVRMRYALEIPYIARE